ncbi:hypothetical protein J34TS1_00430 [Paenibacillus azoreducens]|uniref:Uncharacterized protein n=1 Tax=Paenibacillus azoreducens TaxID=116718 RepID=A0A919Y8T0_9BACL|nr:hypothetical protein J34TS1_00430 [Paenibacillus azoreducens]
MPYTSNINGLGFYPGPFFAILSGLIYISRYCKCIIVETLKVTATVRSTQKMNKLTHAKPNLILMLIDYDDDDDLLRKELQNSVLLVESIS